MNQELVPLNIMRTYPVKWRKEQILRDIVQNFYDDAGMPNFGEKFKTSYCPEARKIILSMESEGFSYEWLMHMGASTKQDTNGKFAGFFGEGFKVASLCALRDYGWSIYMRSRDWEIDVCVIDVDIDGKNLKQLAYALSTGYDFSSETKLVIGNITKDDYKLLNDVALSFYYVSNSLIGKCIFENEYIAIYERSKVPKPRYFPSGLKVSGDGIIFIGFQARAAFSMPLVLCNHSFKTPERERYDIYFGTILDILMDMVNCMDANTCSYMLEALNKYWYDYPNSKEDMDCWYSLIRKLIYRLVYLDESNEVSNNFIDKHPELLVCERPTNIHMRNRKTQALAWRKLHLKGSRLVQDGFAVLGYSSLVNLCEIAGGFNITRNANTKELELLNILHNATKEIFCEFFLQYHLCSIIENDSSSFRGTALMTKLVKKSYNSHGHKAIYSLIKIEIKKSLLSKDCFANAFSTYIHELCHAFGGDASASFSSALTDAMAIITQNVECIHHYEKQWKALC